MKGHGKLLKAKKRWEQANPCLSVTTSLTCGNRPLKIPTAALEQHIPPSFNCSSLKCFQKMEQGNMKTHRHRERCISAFLLWLRVRQLWKLAFHKGQRQRDKYCKVIQGRSLLQPIKNLWVQDLRQFAFPLAIAQLRPLLLSLLKSSNSLAIAAE